ncbi:unnamed protein product [Somion occarium]|uniref:Small nuclear ribonucleoprotein Prp3 C-terminal domain-containing protein n=1 Tax=Somion occarium TaxID=3059160 RepID=A0ABP1CJ68_9APHY
MQGEQITFTLSETDTETWNTLLESYPDLPCNTLTLQSPRFRLTVEGSPIHFEVDIPSDYNGPKASQDMSKDLSLMVSVRGDQISRYDQERWQQIMAECASQLSDSEYPLYELISVYLLPRLHEEVCSNLVLPEQASEKSQASGRPTSLRYHALLTSHHLISPTKRRNLQNWSSQLSITGFAKVGYPGIIYCEGDKTQVEEFVANIKAMQWLALRVRFVEPIPGLETLQNIEIRRRWVEFEKVGELMEEMRRIGRESYVVEMGIGSAGNAVSR